MSCKFRIQALRRSAPALALALSFAAGAGANMASAQAPAGTVEPVHREAASQAAAPAALHEHQQDDENRHGRHHELNQHGRDEFEKAAHCEGIGVRG